MALSDDFYTLDELKELAECKQTKRLIKWLESQGVPFISARNGTPKVHRQAMANRASGNIDNTSKNTSLGPNLSKVR